MQQTISENDSSLLDGSIHNAPIEEDVNGEDREDATTNDLDQSISIIFENTRSSQKMEQPSDEIQQAIAKFFHKEYKEILDKYDIVIKSDGQNISVEGDNLNAAVAALYSFIKSIQREDLNIDKDSIRCFYSSSYIKQLFSTQGIYFTKKKLDPMNFSVTLYSKDVSLKSIKNNFKSNYKGLRLFLHYVRDYYKPPQSGAFSHDFQMVQLYVKLVRKILFDQLRTFKCIENFEMIDEQQTFASLLIVLNLHKLNYESMAFIQSSLKEWTTISLKRLFHFTIVCKQSSTQLQQLDSFINNAKGTNQQFLATSIISSDLKSISVIGDDADIQSLCDILIAQQSNPEIIDRDLSAGMKIIIGTSNIEFNVQNSSSMTTSLNTTFQAIKQSLKQIPAIQIDGDQIYKLISMNSSSTFKNIVKIIKQIAINKQQSNYNTNINKFKELQENIQSKISICTKASLFDFNQVQYKDTQPRQYTQPKQITPTLQTRKQQSIRQQVTYIEPTQVSQQSNLQQDISINFDNQQIQQSETQVSRQQNRQQMTFINPIIQGLKASNFQTEASLSNLSDKYDKFIITISQDYKNYFANIMLADDLDQTISDLASKQKYLYFITEDIFHMKQFPSTIKYYEEQPKAIQKLKKGQYLIKALVNPEAPKIHQQDLEITQIQEDQIQLEDSNQIMPTVAIKYKPE